MPKKIVARAVPLQKAGTFIDMKGWVVNSLEVLGLDESTAGTGTLKWWCKCLKCGRKKSINGSSMRKGVTVSCGCRMLEAQLETAERNKLNGQAERRNTRTFRSWQHMIKRCTDKGNPAWKDYGGRGISVCASWLEDFYNFLADMGECPPQKSIERIDNAGNYEPTNCKWATPKEQANNRRLRCDANLITLNGETHHLSEWARIKGISKITLAGRLKRWSVERALTEPGGYFH